MFNFGRNENQYAFFLNENVYFSTDTHILCLNDENFVNGFVFNAFVQNDKLNTFVLNESSLYILIVCLFELKQFIRFLNCAKTLSKYTAVLFQKL